MNNKITVSIIIPVYNAVSYIHKCLSSLLNQSIKNYEIICVNDASTDETLSVLGDYARRYSNIVVINHQKNKRQGGARNTGIRAAKGLYIGFVDSDDWVEESMYKELYEEAVKYDLDIVDTDYDIINAKGEVLNKCHIFTNDIHNEVVECNRRRLVTMGGSVWGKIYKRTFLLKNNLYFPENLFYEDNCFVPLVYAQMKSYSYIRQCNYHYFVNTDSTTKKKNSSYLYDRFEIANLLKLRFKELNLEKIYKEELDFLLILNGFSGTVNASITTYTYINYDILQRCKEFVKKEVPNYCNNRWYKCKYSFLERILFYLFQINIKLYVVGFKLAQKIKHTI